MRWITLASFLDFLLLPLIGFSLTPITADSFATENCTKRCGNVEIAYPFGIGRNCSLPGFELICHDDHINPILPAYPNLPIAEISNGLVRVNSSSIVSVSTSTWEGIKYRETPASLSLPVEGPYTFPIGSNKFVMIGCGGMGIVTSHFSLLTQCMSLCTEFYRPSDENCNGVGCCEVPLISFSKSVFLEAIPVDNPTYQSNYRYGFMVEDGGYKFKKSDIEDFNHTMKSITMRLEWAVGDSKCLQAVGSSGYACGSNSKCVDSERGSGYLCSCLDGYRGNPYLNGSHGCQDIDECNKEDARSLCVPAAICRNKVPFYECLCPEGSSGDGRESGSGCLRPTPVMQIITGLVVGATACFVGTVLCIWVGNKRKLIKRRAEYFERNGGILLRQHLSSHYEFSNCARIYSAEELKRATKNYNSSRILGSGGHGTVYKGILDDGTTVAIKMSLDRVECQANKFINEIFILTQINHRNVVKLLGCCLETEVPMLVYEYISNGDLHQKIHESTGPSTSLSWHARHQIAVEIAGALSYLHSSTSTPIIHRDLKSSNILLDDDYAPKLADFGLSKLVPLDKSELSTKVLGTFGYLDPEYSCTGKLTAKSDVYSFGVVLLELLTGKEPIWSGPSMEYCGLVKFFLSNVVNDDNFLEVMEEGVVKEAEFEELRSISYIAKSCLSEKAKDRPTMKEVFQELLLLKVARTQNLQQAYDKEGLDYEI